MKKQKFNNFDREKKIHRVVKSNKQNKYKKQYLNYDVVIDDTLIDNENSSKGSKEKQ